MDNTTVIVYFGKAARVTCDRNCTKAWGINGRPRVQLSDDDDDYEWLTDDELGTAPADPGTYEGGQGKPLTPDWFPNKWCVRECERSVMSAPGRYEDDLVLPDFSRRQMNCPYLHPENDHA